MSLYIFPRAGTRIPVERTRIASLPSTQSPPPPIPPPGRIHDRQSQPSRTSHPPLLSRALRSTSNRKINGHFSIENHRFSGAILHYLCIFNGKLKTIGGRFYCNSQSRIRVIYSGDSSVGRGMPDESWRRRRGDEICSRPFRRVHIDRPPNGLR